MLNGMCRMCICDRIKAIVDASWSDDWRRALQIDTSNRSGLVELEKVITIIWRLRTDEQIVHVAAGNENDNWTLFMNYMFELE